MAVRDDRLGPPVAQPRSGSKAVSCHSKQTVFLVYCYIRLHYRSSISLKGLSRLFFIRVDVLSRKFRKEQGVNLSTLITDLRVAEAKRLLQYSDSTIKEICYRVGFSNPQAFCKVFKRLTRLSPHAYREYALNLSQTKIVKNGQHF